MRWRQVVIGDIDIENATGNTAATIKNTGSEAECIRADVTKSVGIQAIVISTVSKYGGSDYAFNNSGLERSTAGVVETSEDDWHRAAATNLTCSWLCMRYEIPELLHIRLGA
jgi:NAD(P)-dependent dehydrogenase (short-subunit alcohol dehydrogenase family)